MSFGPYRPALGQQRPRHRNQGLKSNDYNIPVRAHHEQILLFMFSPLLAALGKRVLGYLHVERIAAQHSIPLYCLGDSGATLEVEHARATVPRGLFSHC